ARTVNVKERSTAKLAATFVIPSRARRRGTSHLVIRHQTCVSASKLRGPLRSLGMTRGQLLSSYENFHAIDIRLHHFQLWRKHNQIGILANCDFTFVGQASLARRVK